MAQGCAGITGTIDARRRIKMPRINRKRARNNKHKRGATLIYNRKPCFSTIEQYVPENAKFEGIKP
jgi:hypothetical protein